MKKKAAESVINRRKRKTNHNKSAWPQGRVAQTQAPRGAWWKQIFPKVTVLTDGEAWRKYHVDADHDGGAFYHDNGIYLIADMTYAEFGDVEWCFRSLPLTVLHELVHHAADHLHLHALICPVLDKNFSDDSCAAISGRFDGREGKAASS